MYIKKIVLDNYKRMFLNNIRHLEYTPEANVQVIVGRNMCGKSSLLKELSPLPAELKKEFRDGGYKEIDIEHLGDNYKLISKIENNHISHSFIKNNEELNPGGTKKVQLELVKQYFKLTPDILDILLNKTRFTQMSPFERKRWFSELSAIDYTYPIGVYNKVRTRHRDIIGGIKLTQDKIISIESKLNNETILEKTKNDKTILVEIRDHIKTLLDVGVDKISSDHVEQIIENTNTLQSCIKEITLDTNIEDLRYIIPKYQTELEHLNKEEARILKEIDLLEKIKDSKDEQELKDKLNNIVKDIELLENKILEEFSNLDKHIINNMETYDKEYTLLLPELISVINTLSEYDKYKDMGKRELDDLEAKYHSIKNSIKILTHSNELFLKDKQHMLDNKIEKNKIMCNSCGNSWYLNYDDKAIEKLDKSIEVNNKKLEELYKEDEKIEKIYTEIKERYNILETLRSIFRGSINLKWLWVKILTNTDINITNSETLLNIFNNYSLKLKDYSIITKLLREQEDIENKLKYIEETKALNINLESTRLELLNNQLHETIKSREEKETKLKQANKEIRVLENMLVNYNNLISTLKLCKREFERSKKALRNEYLTLLIRELDYKIEDLNTTLNAYNASKDIIAKDKNLLNNYKIKEKMLSIVEKVLSPTEGLIAKSINSFLSIFIQEMNDVISNIWSYDLELIPCSIDNEDGLDLDYKFRVKVDNSEVIEDVSKLSSSAQEIVDLAFRIVFVKYMELKEIPLYLDEFGCHFDSKHMNIAYDVIDTLIEGMNNQLFIVCHFENMYAKLRHSDFIILDPNNITTDYINTDNKQIKIK